MVNILGITFGRYILYELYRPVQLCDLVFDSNVQLVTKYHQFKKNKLGILQESMDRLLQNSTDLFVYFEGDVALGMMWGHRGNCYIRGPGISLFQDEETIYWFWIYTAPEARGKNIYKTLRNTFFSHYNGINKFTALVEPANVIMRNEMSKMGFVETKRYIYVKCRDNSLQYVKCNKSQKNYIQLDKGNRHNLILI